jgi:hypothetical protein
MYRVPFGVHRLSNLMLDPLNFKESGDSNFDRMTEICKSKDNLEMVKLAVKAQENDWYGRWVGVDTVAKPEPCYRQNRLAIPLSARFTVSGVESTVVIWPQSIDQYQWDGLFRI